MSKLSIGQHAEQFAERERTKIIVIDTFAALTRTEGVIVLYVMIKPALRYHNASLFSDLIVNPLCFYGTSTFERLTFDIECRLIFHRKQFPYRVDCVELL